MKRSSNLHVRLSRSAEVSKCLEYFGVAIDFETALGLTEAVWVNDIDIYSINVDIEMYEGYDELE